MFGGGTVRRVIFLACPLQLLKVAGYSDQEFVGTGHYRVIGALSVVVSVGLVAVDVGCLVAKQLGIFVVSLAVNVHQRAGTVWDGDHVVKAQKPQLPVVDPHDVRTRLDVDVVGLGGFHRDKIAVCAHQKDHSNIGPAAPLIVGHTVIQPGEETDIVVGYSVNL